MIRRPPRSTRTDTLFPYTTLFRSRRTCLERPFTTIAWVVLPEHLHCLWRLPAGDDDYATRWRLIKSRFSREIPRIERRSASRLAKAERGVWQRRYWEHLVRDETDLHAHVNYIHINPVKHGRSEEHTPALQVTNAQLVCRLLLEKKTQH